MRTLQALLLSCVFITLVTSTEAQTVDPALGDIFTKSGPSTEVSVLVTYVPDHVAPLFSNAGPVQTNVRLDYVEQYGATNGPSNGLFYWRAHNNGYATAIINESGLSALKSDILVDRIDYLPPMHGFDNGTNDLIGATALHSAPTPNLRGQGRVIAIIDSGFDETHPSFASRIIKRECFASGSNRCPNGTRRQSFNPSSPCSQQSPQNCPLLNANEPNWQAITTPGTDHGTAVAGLAGAGGQAGTGLDSGTSPSVDLILINVGERSAGTPSAPVSRIDTDAVLQALEWLLTQNVDVINMSFGNFSSGNVVVDGACDRTSNQNRLFDNLFLQLINQGVALVAASGNSSQTNVIAAPACNSKVISVGSSYANVSPPGPCGNTQSPNDCMGPQSSRSLALTLVAPGFPQRVGQATYFGTQPLFETNNVVATSWSSPVTAGCTALVAQAMSNASLPFDPLAVKGVLASSPNTVTDPVNGRPYKRLNCLSAVQTATGGFNRPVWNFAHSGVWYEPTTAGQGFFWDVNVNGASSYFFGVWYTYTGVVNNATPQNQRWYSLQLNAPFDPNTTNFAVTIYRPHQLTFRQPQVGSPSLLTVGSGSLRFTSCSSALFEYTITDTLLGLPTLTGTVPLVRLAPNSSCVESSSTPGAPPPGVALAAQRGLSGSWFNPSEAGQGFVVDVGDDIVQGQRGDLNAGWFTYRGSGGSSSPSEQRWFTIQQGRYQSASGEWDAKIYQTVGGAFDTPPVFDPLQFTSLAGTATIKFHSCTCATLSYQFSQNLNNPGIQGMQGSMLLKRVGLPPMQCMTFANSVPAGCSP